MKTKVAAVVIAALAGLSGIHYASAEASAITLNGGTMQFVGSLTDGPCAVQATLGERLVELDQVEVNQLKTPGEAAGQIKLFHVMLNDCNISIYTNAKVSFSGQTDSTFSSVLINQASEEAASKVGLQLYGPDGEKIVPNDSSAISLTDGVNVIPLTVDYVPTGINPTAGNVSSTVTFKIIYS